MSTGFDQPGFVPVGMFCFKCQLVPADMPESQLAQSVPRASTAFHRRHQLWLRRTLPEWRVQVRLMADDFPQSIQGQSQCCHSSHDCSRYHHSPHPHRHRTPVLLRSSTTQSDADRQRSRAVAEVCSELFRRGLQPTQVCVDTTGQRAPFTSNHNLFGPSADASTSWEPRHEWLGRRHRLQRAHSILKCFSAFPMSRSHIVPLPCDDSVLSYLVLTLHGRWLKSNDRQAPCVYTCFPSCHSV